MNKQELIDSLAVKMGSNRTEAEKALQAFVDVVAESLRGGQDVNISGFGSFSVSHRAARMGVNPQNPEQKIQIAATKVPKFRAGKGLKDAVR
ncbi:MAG TPA: HU family DNA-binding protein [Candidatus Binatia bacterium]|nr:HU family DNA-binding protein [Candidatus Binatia bacterium]